MLSNYIIVIILLIKICYIYYVLLKYIIIIINIIIKHNNINNNPSKTQYVGTMDFIKHRLLIRIPVFEILPPVVKPGLPITEHDFLFHILPWNNFVQLIKYYL